MASAAISFRKPHLKLLARAKCGTTMLERQYSTRSSVSPPRGSGVLDRLRVETAAVHHDLEQTLNIVGRLCEPEPRMNLVAAYFRFHLVMENALRPFLEDVAALEFSARCRSSRLSVDLLALGCVPPSHDSAIFCVQARAEAMGAFYVVEGSSLGGRTILKELKRRRVSLEGLSFLDAYGMVTGSLWQSFLNILDRETGHAQSEIENAVCGALKAFSFAKEILREGNVSC